MPVVVTQIVQVFLINCVFFTDRLDGESWQLLLKKMKTWIIYYQLYFDKCSWFYWACFIEVGPMVHTIFCQYFRLIHAHRYVEWQQNTHQTIYLLKHVFWSDEPEVKLCRNHGWCRNGKNRIPTVKQGGGGFMLWSGLFQLNQERCIY